MQDTIDPMKRISDMLLEYWNTARGNRLFPSIDDCDFSAHNKETADFHDDSFLIEIIPQAFGIGHKFRYLGSNLNREYNKESKPSIYINNLVTTFLENASEKYQKVSTLKQPIIEEDVIQIKDNEFLKYRQILLPLASDNYAPVSGILGGMRYRKSDDDTNNTDNKKKAYSATIIKIPVARRGFHKISE